MVTKEFNPIIDKSIKRCEEDGKMTFDTKIEGVTEETQSILDKFFYIMKNQRHIVILSGAKVCSID